MSKQKTQTKHTREFSCLLCDPNGTEQPMDAAGIKAHLLEVHKLPSMKGKKQGIQFLDGADFYSNTYEWTFPCEVGEVKVLENSSGPKKGMYQDD